MNRMKILPSNKKGNPNVYCLKENKIIPLTKCFMICPYENGTDEYIDVLFCNYKKPLLEKLEKLEELFN